MLKWKIGWQNLINKTEFVAIVLAVVLLPIDRLPYLHHIPFGLGFISLILLLIPTAARLIELIRAKHYADLKRYLFVGCLLALPVLAYAQSIFYAIDRPSAIHATKSILSVTLRAFCFFVLVSRRPGNLQLIKKTIYIMTAVVVGFGLFQFLFDIFGGSPKITDLRSCCTSNSTYTFPRVYSTALEPLYLANFLMIPLWLLSFDFWKDKESRRNKYLVILFVLTGALFMLSLARSAFVGLIIGALVFYIGARKKALLRSFLPTISRLWGASIVLTILLVLVSGIASVSIPKTAINGANAGVVGNAEIFSTHAVAINDGSAKTRYDLWPKALAYIKEQPVRGVGADNSRVRLNLSAYNSGTPTDSLQPFNNDLLSLLVDLGLIGVVAFGPLLAVLLVAIYRMAKSGWQHAAAPFGLILVSMLIQGNFFQSLLLTRLWVVVGLVLTFYIVPPSKKAAR